MGTWVPVEMRERYDNSWGEVTTGRATYTNYRKFRTSARLVPPVCDASPIAARSRRRTRDAFSHACSDQRQSLPNALRQFPLHDLLSCA